MARLSPTGSGVAVGSSVVLAAGVALGYPELRMIGAAGLAALIAGLAGAFGRLRVEVHREVEPERVERGEVALGLVQVHNPTPRTTRPTIAIDQAGPNPVAVPLPSLAAGARATRTYRLPTGRRGLIPVGPLRLERADPLRCWTMVQELGEAKTLVVTPRVLPLVGVPTGRTRSLDGPTADTTPRGTVVFHTLREYVPGDERRHIHWKASAKAGALLVKQHVDTSEPKVSVLLATSSATYADADTFEEAVDVAASVAVALARLRFSVRVLTPGHGLAGGRAGTNDPTVVLDHLAGLPDRSGPPPAPFLVELGRERIGDGVIIVTGSVDDQTRSAAAQLRRRYPTVVLASVRPDATTLPTRIVPGVVLLDGRTAEEVAAAWGRAFAGHSRALAWR